MSITTNPKPRVAVMWSGGKDSALTLDRLKTDGVHNVVTLITIVSIEHNRSVAHGFRPAILESQAEALALPLNIIRTDGPGYFETVGTALAEIARRDQLSHLAFGTLYVEADRGWNTSLAERGGLKPLFPLWGAAPQDLFVELLKKLYRAKICRARANVFAKSWVGKELSLELGADLTKLGSCVMGENGEYHTLVTGGPTFTKELTPQGVTVSMRDDLWSMDITSLS